MDKTIIYCSSPLPHPFRFFHLQNQAEFFLVQNQHFVETESTPCENGEIFPNS